MTLKYSTGFRDAQLNAALGTAPAAAAMDGCVLMIYEGSEPEYADSEIGEAVLLATYSTNNTGEALVWGEPSGGTASKNPSDAWSATAVDTGTPSFFRYQQPGDAGGESASEIRIQGRVGPLSDPYADLALSSMSIVTGAPLTIDAASATAPEQV